MKSTPAITLMLLALGVTTAREPLSAAEPPPNPPSQPAPPSVGALPTIAGKFAELDVRKRAAFLDEMQKQDLTVIFQAMLDAGRVDRDGMKQMGLRTVLSVAMQERVPSAEFLQQMKAFVDGPTNPKFERELLLGAFALAGTASAVDFLTLVATTSPDPGMRQTAKVDLASVGNQLNSGSAVSSSFERTWRESKDPELLSAAAVSMAKLGAPAGVELLLASALSTDSREKKQRDLARSAVLEIFRRTAVPPVAARLATEKPASPAGAMLGGILLNIGDTTAARALVTWLQAADDSAAPLAHQLVLETHSPAMAQAWEAALSPTVHFRSAETRNAVRDAFKQYQSGKTFETVR